MNDEMYRRLLEVACRRLGGQSWKRIAREMGWNSHQAAHIWAKRTLHKIDR